MTVITFDAYNAVKRLIQNGLQEKLAEEFVKIFTEIKDVDFDKVASKEQVAVLEKDFESFMKHIATKEDLEKVRTDVEKVRTEVRIDVEKVRTDLEKVRTDLEKVRTEVRIDVEKVRTDVEKVRTDVEKVRTEVRTDVEKVRTELHKSENRLILIIGGAVVAICSVIVGAVQYLLLHLA